MSDAHDRLAGLDSDRLAQLAAEHPDEDSVATCDVCGSSDEHEHDADELFDTFDATALEFELLRRFVEALELGEGLSVHERPQLVSVHTFAQAGLLTRDRGVVLSCDDGSEFQLTIVQSRTAR